MKPAMIQLCSLGASIKAALATMSAACERLYQTCLSIEKEVVMWSSHIMDYPAHWLLIAHNSRNNIRTKRRK